MNVLSTFSGVGGLDLGLERAGMRVVFQAEVDEWRRRVLRWHWPHARIYDDVRSVRESASGDSDHSVCAAIDEGRREAGAGLSVDLLCGGFPCQDLSIAGRRAGLAGERSGLFFEFARIADEFRPRWLIVENVPGLLSSADGRDFGVVLATLGDLGYGLAWRVLDARFFGVPQRRRRVFVVGHSGGEPEPAVRAVGAGGFGDSASRGCSWQGASCGIGGRTQARCITAHGQRLDGDTENFIVSTSQMCSVRRLTPVECERLMSWPDDWTAVDGENTPDGRRYAACGDGVVSNVAEWIARGILQEDAA